MASTKTLRLFTAILWIIWGVVHMFAGGMTIALDATSAVQGIADGVDPALLDVAYPDAAGAIINQHGFNLFWIGLTTVVGGGYIVAGSRTALWLCALVGGLADVGYFLFIDLGGFNNFVPGTVMTLISGTAVILGFILLRRSSS
ncbi:MAG: hypothetical protein AAGD10_21100 [Myxococcota bacterium]